MELASSFADQAALAVQRAESRAAHHELGGVLHDIVGEITADTELRTSIGITGCIDIVPAALALQAQAVGPKGIFSGAVAWLRARQALLPGITTLERLVTEGRRVADQRLWSQLDGQVPASTWGALLALLDAPVDARGSRSLSAGPRTQVGHREADEPRR